MRGNLAQNQEILTASELMRTHTEWGAGLIPDTTWERGAVDFHEDRTVIRFRAPGGVKLRITVEASDPD